MKNVVLLTAVLLLLATCKKNHSGPICTLCAGESNQINFGFDPWDADSAIFTNWLLGKWYLKQQQYYPDDQNCQSTCYNDTGHYFIFLANHTIIRHLPNNKTDTVMYTFVRDSTGIIPSTFGTFFYWPDVSAAPHDTTLCGIIQTGTNYIMVGADYNYPITNPAIGIHYPTYAYGLTR
jgi:hypothetical protein